MRFCSHLRYGKDKQILRICKTAWADAAARAARPLRGLGRRCRPSPVATPRSGPDEHRKPTWARTCKASVKGARGCRASAVQTPALLDRPSIRGVGAGGQLSEHSPPQTAGRVGDVDRSCAIRPSLHLSLSLFSMVCEGCSNVVLLH